MISFTKITFTQPYCLIQRCFKLPRRTPVYGRLPDNSIGHTGQYFDCPMTVDVGIWSYYPTYAMAQKSYQQLQQQDYRKSSDGNYEFTYEYMLVPISQLIYNQLLELEQYPHSDISPTHDDILIFLGFHD